MPDMKTQVFHSILKRLRVATYMKQGECHETVAEDLTDHAVMPILRQNADTLVSEDRLYLERKIKQLQDQIAAYRESYVDGNNAILRVLTLDRRTGEWNQAFEELRAYHEKMTGTEVDEELRDAK